MASFNFIKTFSDLAQGSILAIWDIYEISVLAIWGRFLP